MSSQFIFGNDECDNISVSAPVFFMPNDERISRKSIFKNSYLNLNIGGTIHQVLLSNLEKIPSSRLCRIRFANKIEDIRELCDDCDNLVNKNEIFFDRQSSSAFGCILSFYRTGKLHLTADICIIAFSEEMSYWGLEEHLFESCCHLKYHQRLESMLDDIRKEHDDEESQECLDVGELAEILEENEKSNLKEKTDEINKNLHKMSQFKKSAHTKNYFCFSAYKDKIWNLMEYPKTSIPARCIATLSIFFILLSTVTLALNTMPEFQEKVKININETAQIHKNKYINESSTQTIIFLVDNPLLEKFEIICIVYFTIEFLLRILSTPCKLKFIKSLLNIIDFLSIVPYYISLIVVANRETNHSNFIEVRRILVLFRVLRIVRIFKLARHSVGLKSFGYTLKRSYKELGLLMMCVSIAVLSFSSLAYLAEREEPDTKFVSIPVSFWWAVITLTTVGYGDMVPSTLIGKIIGAICCICGVLIVGLPIPIIVNNFNEFYVEQKRREKSKAYKEKLHDKNIKNRYLNSVNNLFNYEDFDCISSAKANQKCKAGSSDEVKIGCNNNQNSQQQIVNSLKQNRIDSMIS